MLTFGCYVRMLTFFLPPTRRPPSPRTQLHATETAEMVQNGPPAFQRSQKLANDPCLGRLSYRVICVSPSLRAPCPPIRDPHTGGYVTAKELPDRVLPRPNGDGNYILGPTHTPSPDINSDDATPNGTVVEFTMNSTDSKIYPGIARDANTFGTPDTANPAKLIVTTSHPAPYTRKVAVYVPKQYVAGDPAPFIVGADGPDPVLFSALDTLIAQHKLPVMIGISIGNGGGDAQGSERGLEYDTMSGTYAEFVETEVLPQVESKAHVKLTKDPNARATMGYSSGGACALSMAWYHPELYHRVLSYSGTFVNQQCPTIWKLRMARGNFTNT